MVTFCIRTRLPELAGLYLLFSLSYYANADDISAEEILRRKSLVRPYIDEKHEDWIETYEDIWPSASKTNKFHASAEANEFKSAGSKTNKFPASAEANEFKSAGSKTNKFPAPAEANEFKSAGERCSCSTVRKDKEGYYLTHWLNKLLRKISSLPGTSSKTISFFLSEDSFMEITDLASGKFDLNSADELISDLISNATINYGYTVGGYFHFDGTLNFYFFLIFVLAIVLILIFLYYPYFFIFLTCMVIFLICFASYYYVKHQEVWAKKHAVVSGMAPSNCESILLTESGIFAHIKEFFRYHRYNEDCKKYYRALLIEPWAELPISTVFTEFLSASFFSFFKPMASVLNTFVKDLFKDMGFTEIAISFIFIFTYMLIRNKYTVKLPFLMGSIQAPPPVISIGSRVEDLQLKSHPEKENKSSVTITNKYGSSIIHQANNCSSLIIFNDKDCSCKTTNVSLRRNSL